LKQLFQGREDLRSLVPLLETVQRALRERNEALNLEVYYQKELLELQKAQDQLNFLKQQSELLDLIKQHGLDANAVLQGLQLGLEADPLQLVQAITRALQMVVQQTEKELGIHSPSSVFFEFGRQIMRGLANGITAGAGLAERAMGRALPGRPGYALSPALAGRGGDSYNLHIYTNAPSEPIIRDFRMMQAMSRG
jgi:hypothetical protein